MTTVAHSTAVTQFRARRDGPEALMQDVVVHRIPDLFCPTQNSWTAASLPLGAGVPDLVVVSYDPQVFALAHVDLTDAQILAYLRAVGKARLDTIAERMGTSPKKISGRLSSLVEAEAIATTANTFSLSPLWRQILPEIVSIEVKISKWQRAIEQAARNRIFAHRSFVALPQKVVERIRSEKVIAALGIGLISVSEDGTAKVVKKPRRRHPTVWTYYYQLASILARSQSN
jgi:DNA-binding Lrp family transcriptional regulator